MLIHPTAVISPEAQIAPDVYIGPFCVIIGKVTIGAGCRLENHVTIGSPSGIVTLGTNNSILAYAAIGGPPQDLSYNGDPTQLVIGNHNVIRECATINIGTVKGGGKTRVGDHCLIMAYCHIAHDCEVGDRVVIANSTQLAGHVHIEEDVKIGGICAFNQFVRVGAHSYIAGDSAVNKDIAPYTMAQGKYAVMRAPNQIGLERAGFSKQDIEGIRKAVKLLIRSALTVDEVVAQIEKDLPQSPALKRFTDFIRTSERGLAR
jgi:UDP-N-acetylglucosamine acyltransferase